jgi:hypothetical protein
MGSLDTYEQALTDATYPWLAGLSRRNEVAKRSGETRTCEKKCKGLDILVNFALPANIMHGSGFGVINHTAGPSRQIQFSLKLIF